MKKLSREDLFPLEHYATKRADFRQQVIAHKKPRKLFLGDHLSFHFEDRVTIQYQIQEMLRVEKIFEPDGIQEELDAYNPLIPDGSNLKATMMIEFADEGDRKKALASLLNIESLVYFQVQGYDKVYAIADEDLDRATAEKTSSVHFLRFEFSPEMIEAMKSGAPVCLGSDHQLYLKKIERIPAETMQALIADFN